jgi:hypothetical protein
MNSLTLSGAHKKLDRARKCLTLFKKWEPETRILWVDAHTTLSSKISIQNTKIYNHDCQFTCSSSFRGVRDRKTNFGDKNQRL